MSEDLVLRPLADVLDDPVARLGGTYLIYDTPLNWHALNINDGEDIDTGWRGPGANMAAVNWLRRLYVVADVRWWSLELAYLVYLIHGGEPR